MKEPGLKRERSISLVVFTMILAFTASCADPVNDPVSTNSGSNPPPDYVSGPRIFGHTSATLDGLDALTGGTGFYGMQRYENEGRVHLSDTFMANNVGYYPDWVTETRTYPGDVDGNGRGSEHPEFNVIMWSWCGQLSSKEADAYCPPAPSCFFSRG